MSHTTVDIYYHDDFKESDHPRSDSGQFGAANIAKAIGAPAHANIHESGGEHGGGTIGWAESHEHSIANKRMKQGGFIKTTSKGRTVSTKLGRSTAYTSAKEQRSDYSHPSGHTATVRTNTPKYGGTGPKTYYNINLRK